MEEDENESEDSESEKREVDDADEQEEQENAGTVSYTHLEYRTMLKNQLSKGNNGLVKTKYITFGIEAESLKVALSLIHI